MNLRGLFAVLIGIATLVGLSNEVSAQEQPVVVTDGVDWSKRYPETTLWMKVYTEYKVWEERWLNRRQPGTFKGYEERREKPSPPNWLQEGCRSFDQSELVFLLDWEEQNRKNLGSDNSFQSLDIVQRACALVLEWKDDFGANLIRRQIVRARQEKSRNTIFRLTTHLDAGYMPAETGGSAYSPIGMHITVLDMWNRIQTYGPPGVMWVMVRNQSGGYDSTFGYSWGFSVRITDLTFPGTSRPISIHANLIKCWITSRTSSVGNIKMDGMSMVGASITWKKP